MNNKCYVDVGPSTSRKFSARPAVVGLLVSVAGGLLLAACSSQGSSFGGSAGAGVVDNSAGSGTANPGGGSATGPAGGAGPTGGGDTGAGDTPGSGGQSVGLGGAAPGGGASPIGGGAGPVGGAGPNGGAGPSAGAGPAGGAPPGGAGAGAGPACPKPVGQICHEFFAADNSRNQILYVNEFDPSKNWTKKVSGNASQNSPRAIQVVDHPGASNGKAVMVSIEKGFQEFDMATGASLSTVSTLNGITSALRIPAGDTHTSLPAGTTILAILGAGNAAQLAYVSPAGATVKPTVTMAFASAGTEMRKLERDPATGNLSFTKFESTTTAYIYIVTELGASVSKIKLPSGAKGYNAIWLDGGKMQATTGDQASVITIDAAGAVSATLGGKNMVKDASGAIVYTDFFSGFFRLPNGNVVAANWLGHQDPAAHPTTPELLEFSPDNKLAWSWGNQTLATFVTFGYFLR